MMQTAALLGIMLRTVRRHMVGAGIAAIAAGVLLAACAGTPPPEPAEAEDLFLQEILEIPGASREQLFEHAKVWAARQFSGELDVIRFANRDQGVIMAKTFINHSRPNKTWGSDQFEFRFSLMVETKDERMRVTFNNMSLIGTYGPETILKSDMEEIRPRLEASLKNLAASFEKPQEDDDW
jgi:hypothetical protein